MMILKFLKEEKNRWYIDLPNWSGRKSALEMVAGADKLLDFISNGKNSVELYIDTEQFTGANCLTKINTCWFNGADYKIDLYDNYQLNLKIWLCDVTKHVLGDFPDKIYFSKINTK